MRLKFAGIMLLAGTVVGCASNPPPPPPMAAMPEPAPMPAPAPMASNSGPMSGTYRGMADASDQRGCRPMRGSQTARVRNNTIMVAGMRGRIGQDGSITGRGLSGTVNGNNADVTVTKGKCTYHYNMTM